MEEKYGIHFTEELLTAPEFGPMTREVMDTVQSVLDMNDPVGLAAGYYTDRLPIVCASRFFAEMLGYERERQGRVPGRGGADDLLQGGDPGCPGAAHVGDLRPAQPHGAVSDIGGGHPGDQPVVH